MQAVANVVKNRSEILGITPSEVVRQFDPRSRFAQFSYQNERDPNLTRANSLAQRNAQIYQKAVRIAAQVFSGSLPDITGGALFYHTTAVRPSWRKHYTQSAIIGDHIFYGGEVAESNLHGLNSRLALHENGRIPTNSPAPSLFADTFIPEELRRSAPVPRPRPEPPAALAPADSSDSIGDLIDALGIGPSAPIPRRRPQGAPGAGRPSLPRARPEKQSSFPRAFPRRAEGRTRLAAAKVRTNPFAASRGNLTEQSDLVRQAKADPSMARRV